jgi:hypothetical protein
MAQHARRVYMLQLAMRSAKARARITRGDGCRLIELTLAVAAGQWDRLRNTAVLGDEMVIEAQPAAIYLSPAGSGRLLSAGTGRR